MNEFPISIGGKRTSPWQKIGNAAVVIFAIFIALQLCFFARFAGFYVEGSSMSPTLTGATAENAPGGDFVYVDKRAVPERGDIVVIAVDGHYIVKRVIALGGDRVELRFGQLYLNGEPVREPYVAPENNDPTARVNTHPPVLVPTGYMYFLGDNRDASVDSRSTKYGTRPVSSVVGVVPDWSLKYKRGITNLNTFLNFGFAPSGTE